MEYNIAKNGITETNTELGSVSFSSEEIGDLLNKSLSKIITTPDTLVIDTDLGYRINTSQIRYYFNSTSASGTVSGSLNFYHLDEENYGYLSSPVSVGSGYYYTTISGFGAPRKIRLVHTVSGTSISGTVVGFEILNNDTIVDFGDDGSKTSEGFITSIVSDASIKTIPIYNSGATKATAYISLDPQCNNVDELVSVSETSTGPWYGPNINNSLLAYDEDSWDEGNYSNTEVSLDKLVLSAGQSTGTYTSKIFYDDSIMSYTLLGLDDEYCNLVSMEVRSTDTPPDNLGTLIDVYYDIYRFYVEEKYWESETVVYNNGGVGIPGSFSSASEYFVKADNRNGFIYTLVEGHSGVSNTATIIYCQTDKINDSNNALYLSQHSNESGYAFYDMGFDSSKGVWFSYYNPFDNTSSYEFTAAGYYLAYIDVNLNVTAKLRSSSAFVGAMSVIYDTGELWYINSSDSQVIKLAKNSDVLAYVVDADYITDLVDIAASSDGGCWFINGENIHKTDTLGTVTFSIEDVGNSLSKIELDPEEDGIWLLDGAYIKYIHTDGREVFSYFTSNQSPSELYPVLTGVWYKATNDGTFRFINKPSQTELTSHAYNLELSNSTAAVRESSYNTEGFTSEFPIPGDTVWNNLDWRPVDYRNHILSDYDYHQIRLTLTEEGSARPEVDRLSTQNSLELKNISSNAYKDVYMKTEIPDSTDTSYLGDYDTYLRVRWGIPI